MKNRTKLLCAVLVQCVDCVLEVLWKMGGIQVCRWQGMMSRSSCDLSSRANVCSSVLVNFLASLLLVEGTLFRRGSKILVCL